MHTRRHKEYIEGQEEDDVVDVYQEQTEEHQNFTLSDEQEEVQQVTPE
jgi:hypothetical protein